METRFLRPHVLWGGVFGAIFLVLASIGYWQSQLYWKNSFELAQQRELQELRTLLPYSLAFLEEHGQPGLIRELLSRQQDLFVPIYEAPGGAVKYPDTAAASARNILPERNGYKVTYVYKTPHPSPEADLSPSVAASSRLETAPNGAAVYGKLYLLPRKLPPIRRWPGESFLVFTLIGYTVVLVGLAAICSITAKYQSHFQGAQEEQHRSELEARDLRIQVLESNLETLDLRLQILDKDHEKAIAASHKAKTAIDRLDKKLQKESTKNEELEAGLHKAQLEHQKALQAIRDINEDRQRLAEEKRALESMRQAEETQMAGRVISIKPKEFLWLHLVYKNLAFSKRAMQNIIDLQYVHDLFPSLPDALSALNQGTVEALMSGEGFPSRNVVRYSQPLQNHPGYLWEYRFSKDGRIFFGLSQSRTLNIDTILLKRRFSQNRYKYEKYLEQTLGKENDDLTPELSKDFGTSRNEIRNFSG